MSFTPYEDDLNFLFQPTAIAIPPPTYNPPTLSYATASEVTHHPPMSPCTQHSSLPQRSPAAAVASTPATTPLGGTTRAPASQRERPPPSSETTRRTPAKSELDSRITIFNRDFTSPSIIHARHTAQRCADAYVEERRARKAAEGRVTGATHVPRARKRKAAAGSPGRARSEVHDDVCDGDDDGGGGGGDSAHDNVDAVRKARRLELNRESAGVSRVRRREYIRELEGAVEIAETGKKEAEEQLRTMVQENEMLKRKLATAQYAAENGFAHDLFADWVGERRDLGDGLHGKMTGAA